MKHDYKPVAEHYIPRPDWAITDEQYASWGHSHWAPWHSECPLWWLWRPVPNKPGEVYPTHFNREDSLIARMAQLDADGITYVVHTIRNPSYSLQAMLERIAVMSENRETTPAAVVQPRGAYAQVQPVNGVSDKTEPAPPPATMTVAPEAPATISIDELGKIDLRVGVVLSAERVPKSDKLLKMQVDLGEGQPRQILAGIGKTYSPDEMVGKLVTVVANLPPRKMMGHESQGMVLAAGEPENLALLTPTKAVAAGARLR